jgi:hypothetical protein
MGLAKTRNRPGIKRLPSKNQIDWMEALLPVQVGPDMSDRLFMSWTRDPAGYTPSSVAEKKKRPIVVFDNGSTGYAQEVEISLNLSLNGRCSVSDITAHGLRKLAESVGREVHMLSEEEAVLSHDKHHVPIRRYSTCCKYEYLWTSSTVAL